MWWRNRRRPFPLLTISKNLFLWYLTRKPNGLISNEIEIKCMQMEQENSLAGFKFITRTWLINYTGKRDKSKDGWDKKISRCVFLPHRDKTNGKNSKVAKSPDSYSDGIVERRMSS